MAASVFQKSWHACGKSRWTFSWFFFFFWTNMVLFLPLTFPTSETLNDVCQQWMADLWTACISKPWPHNLWVNEWKFQLSDRHCKKKTISAVTWPREIDLSAGVKKTKTKKNKQEYTPSHTLHTVSYFSIFRFIFFTNACKNCKLQNRLWGSVAQNHALARWAS